MSYNTYDENEDLKAFRRLVRQNQKDRPLMNPHGGRRGGIIDRSVIEELVRNSEEVRVISDLVDSLRRQP